MCVQGSQRQRERGRAQGTHCRHMTTAHHHSKYLIRQCMRARETEQLRERQSERELRKNRNVLEQSAGEKSWRKSCLKARSLAHTDRPMSL